MTKKVARLYEQFQPEHYDLTLDIDREAMTFSGKVIIKGKKVGRPSQRFTLHQKELKFTDASAIKHDKNGDRPVKILRLNSQDTLNELRLHSDSMIYPGEYTLSIEFTGKINDQMHGIYPCYYTHEGQSKTLIATQFESHHAREAFPCIDEPEAKATFDLTVITDSIDVVLSNMPAKETKDSDGRKSVKFDSSPKMSSYLLAFVTGEMHSVSSKAADGTLVSSWATVAQSVDHLEYANKEAINILDFFIEYFSTPFPLPKYDQVALPDFESMAMENWGLVTFREVGLLSDPNNPSISGQQLITLVIAHELSHQWFGNLVTMKWWDDLWLNESFASIMENIAPDKLHPDWHQWEEFATSRALSASQRDVYKDVQAVSVEVTHPDEILTLFDPAIVYAKGARLLTMLFDYIGEEAFQTGLKNYFKKHAFKNTTRDDLWKEFSEASGQDIESLMAPWLRQSGMPKLTVETTKANSYELSQKRFLLDGEDSDSLWPVPLLANQTISPDILTKKSSAVEYISKDQPILNINGNGHYIVYYVDKNLRKKLYSKVIDQSLEPTARINILNDLMLLSRGGQSSITEILDIIKQCPREPRDSVWMMFTRAIGSAQQLTDGDKHLDIKIRQFKSELASYWYKKLGWNDAPNDDPNTKHLRTTALALSIAGEDKDAIKTALDMYGSAGSVAKLPAEQRSMVAGAAVRLGKKDVIGELLKEYETTSSSEVRESIIGALCSTRDPDVARRIFEWGLSPKSKIVKPQDMSHWFAYMMRNFYTRDVAWQWMTSNWPYLASLFGGGKNMEYFIWYSAGPLSTAEWQKRFKDFFEPMTNEPGLARNIKIGINEIAARIEWRNREEDAIKNFFNS